MEYLGTWESVEMKADGPVSVHRYGNTAVVVNTWILNGWDEKNLPYTNHLQSMAIWVLRDDHWQIEVMQTKSIDA